MVVTDADCKEEVVYSKDLFYWPSGLNIKVNEGAEIIMFSPQEEHAHVINHMIYNLEKRLPILSGEPGGSTDNYTL